MTLWVGDDNAVVSSDLDPIHHWAFAAQAISFPCSVFLLCYGLKHMGTFRKKVTNRFPIYIAFADMVFGVTHFFDHLTILTTHRFPHSSSCLFFAWALEFFMLANMVNVLAIGIYCLLLLRSKGSAIDTGKYDWKLLIVTYGGPFVFSMFPFITDDYGHDGAWCWIKGSPGNSPKIVYNLVPLVVVLVLNIAVLSNIYFRVRESGATNNAGNAGNTVIKRALLFVLAYIIQFTPLTVYTVVAISGGTVSFGYVLAVVTTINLGGLLNGFAYGRAAIERVEQSKRQSKTPLTSKGTSSNLQSPSMLKIEAKLAEESKSETLKPELGGKPEEGGSESMGPE